MRSWINACPCWNLCDCGMFKLNVLMFDVGFVSSAYGHVAYGPNERDVGMLLHFFQLESSSMIVMEVARWHIFWLSEGHSMV